VLGDEYVDRASSSASSFSAPFQELITRHAWERSGRVPGSIAGCVARSASRRLVSVRAENEIELHVRAALRNGLTVEEAAID
jgi:4-carboxymuconolactone decarboxylase